MGSAEILGGLLGLSDAEIDQLARDGIIGTEMLMEEQLVKEKKRAGLLAKAAAQEEEKALKA